MRTFPLTLQQAFDIAYKKVIDQGEPSIKDGDCIYNGPNGLHCAASFVFMETDPDVCQFEWDTDEPGVNARDALHRLGYLEFTLSELMLRIQRAHDYAADSDDFVNDYRVRMAGVAQDFALNIPEESK
jgi:hypothetical protein